MNFSNAMRAAGFSYTGRGDSTRCILCRLEVSCWTCNMDPFTVHSERSPHCVFVRSVQSSSHSQTASLSTIDSMSERPAKRQKTDAGFSINELDKIKEIRHRTFSHWPHPMLFRFRMIEAGFFGCIIDDRAICLYCNLICHKWNIEIDDPCEVHKNLSPNCPFVKSMSCCHSPQYNKNVSILPNFIDYVNPQKRSASFATWSNDQFPSIDKLVEAGFFYNGSKITCFYCNGSFQNWKSNNHPIAEHVRSFPHCNYARQLCGEELYQKIQHAIKYKSGNIEIDELKNDHLRLNESDDDTLALDVAARLDLPISKYLLEKNFQRSTIERCWADQLRFKNDDFANDCDLRIACEIFEKQIEIIDKQKKNIIIPSISLKEIYEKGQICLVNYSNQSYLNILESFENDHQTYKNNRQTLNRQFTEDITITIEREQSLNNCSRIKPSRYDMIKGGWIIYDTENYTSKCPHCHMQYCNWKSDDNPLLIHQYLSPLCPFVLSSNPFNSNPIPIRKVCEQFTDEDIKNAESQPYIGLVQTKYNSFYLVSDRQTSFNGFTHNHLVNTNELAIQGFFYTNRDRSIECFYCARKMFFWNQIFRTNQYFKNLHSSTRCRYIQQLNDHDLETSNQQGSNKCTWCMTEDKRLLALPCRHLCLCELCGQVKQLCPICKKNVTAYVIVYLS